MGIVAASWTLSALTIVAVGQPSQRDFNGPDLTWQLLDDGVTSRVISHECVAGGASDNAGCEHVYVVAPVGQSAQLMCSTELFAVLDELEVRLWVKATQPGVQLAARIILPRSVNEKSQSNVSLVCRGERYRRVGQWQQLVLTDVRKSVAEQVRVLRTAHGAAIDPREAFVDGVVLVVPGGPEGVQVWTDDLKVEGVVLKRETFVRPAIFASPAAAPIRSRAGAESVASAAVPTTASVQMQGALLLVEGKPYFPRAIQWQGEPLRLLFDCGFNTILLSELPTPQQSNEARRLGLWFMCTPPKPDAMSAGALGHGNDRILGWYLKEEFDRPDPNLLRRWAELIRRHDPIAGRPIVIEPESDWTSGSRAADIVAVHHLLASRMSATDFAWWWDSRPRLVNPGTPLWLCLSTQFGNSVREQCEAISGGTVSALNVSDRQLELLWRTVLAKGLRGYVVLSNQSLIENEAITRRRAALLELINRQLQLLEPWLAGGKIIGEITSTDQSRTAVIMQAEYARLIVPLPTAENGAATSTTATRRLAGKAFIVPGVPESSQAFVLTPVELRSVPAQRVAGGMRIVWEGEDDAFLLLTEDPRVIGSLRQHVVRDANRVVRVERDLTAATAATVADTLRRLSSLGVTGGIAGGAVASIDAQLRQVDALLAAGNAPQAFRLGGTLRRAMQDAIEEQYFAVAGHTEVGVYPLALSFDQLAAQAQFLSRSHSLRAGENMLYGGDFEDLGQLTGVGWQHVSHSSAGVTASAELSTDSPYHGRHCLELRTAAEDPKQVPTFVASPPLWITSPNLPVEEGQILEITGWVRVAAPITGSVEGLQIIDSLGGPELALTIRETSGWRPFQMVRASTASTDLRLTFVLTGLGTAHIDGVMVRPLQQPVARRLPPVESSADLSQSSGFLGDVIH